MKDVIDTPTNVREGEAFRFHRSRAARCHSGRLPESEIGYAEFAQMLFQR